MVHFEGHGSCGSLDGGHATPAEPLLPLDAYAQKVQSSRARGTVYPYELIPLLTGTKGTFVEHDFDEAGVLSPVERPYGLNKAGIVVGLVNTPTPRYPEGMTRVALFGDPTKALGTVAEAECSRVVAAIDQAEKLNAPVEWFALSSGATISMESGDRHGNMRSYQFQSSAVVCSVLPMT